MTIDKVHWKIKTTFGLLLAFIFLAGPQLKLLAISTTFYDLGAYGHILFSYKSADSYAGGHVNIYLIPFASLYKSLPGELAPHVLLLIQSLGLIVVAYRVFKNYSSTVFLFFVLAFPFWYLNLFDFHFEFIALFLLNEFFISLKRKRYAACVCWTILLALSKELYIATAIFCGIYLIVSAFQSPIDAYRKKILVVGFSILFVNCLIIIFVLNYVTNGFSSVTQGEHLSPFVASSVDAIIGFAPNFFEKFSFFNIFEFKNLIFVVGLLACFNFFPLRYLSPMVVVVPNIVVACMSTDSQHAGLSSHYASMFLPAMAFASSRVLERKISSSPNVYSMFLVPVMTSILISPAPWGVRFLADMSAKYGFSAYLLREEDALKKRKLDHYFSDRKDASISVQNNFNIPVIFNRERVSAFPENVCVEVTESPAEYVVIDVDRPMFFRDRPVSKTQESRGVTSTCWRYLDEHFSLVFRYGGLTVLERRYLR